MRLSRDTGISPFATLLLVAAVVTVIAGASELTRRFLRPPQVPETPAWTARLVAMLPFTTAIVALLVRRAAGLHLAVRTVWTLGQRVTLRRRYPIEA